MNAAFEEICRDLSLNWHLKRRDFEENLWENMSDKGNYHQSFLKWLLARRFKPKTVLQLGGTDVVWRHALAEYNGTVVALNSISSPGSLAVVGDVFEKLPLILSRYPVELVSNDYFDTWEPMHRYVKTLANHSVGIIQVSRTTTFDQKAVMRDVFPLSEYYFRITGKNSDFGLAIHEKVANPCRELSRR